MNYRNYQDYRPTTMAIGRGNELVTVLANIVIDNKPAEQNIAYVFDFYHLEDNVIPEIVKQLFYVNGEKAVPLKTAIQTKKVAYNTNAAEVLAKLHACKNQEHFFKQINVAVAVAVYVVDNNVFGGNQQQKPFVDYVMENYGEWFESNLKHQAFSLGFIDVAADIKNIDRGYLENIIEISTYLNGLSFVHLNDIIQSDFIVESNGEEFDIREVIGKFIYQNIEGLRNSLEYFGDVCIKATVNTMIAGFAICNQHARIIMGEVYKRYFIAMYKKYLDGITEVRAELVENGHLYPHFYNILTIACK